MQNEEVKRLSPVKAIRAKCIDCCCGNRNEVKACPITDCSLYPYRLGKNPYKAKREYTEEEKRAIAERLAAYREKQKEPTRKD